MAATLYHIDWLHKADEDITSPRLNTMAAATLNHALPYIKPDFWVYVKTVKSTNR